MVRRPPSVASSCVEASLNVDNFFRAHGPLLNAEVARLWARYEQCCDYVTLADLPEAKAMFPSVARVSS